MDKKRKYLHVMSTKTYETILKLTLGTFDIKCKDRTREEKNAALRFWRNKSSFSVENGKLKYDGREVLQASSIKSVVQKGFTKAATCGARPLAIKLKKKYTGMSERQVRREYSKSKYYHQAYPKFTNKPPPKAVTAEKVNERWQIDLMDMKSDQILKNGETYKYILSVVDVFSRFVILRPLTGKSSSKVARELERIFAEHGTPSIIQTDQGTEFKGKVKKMLKSNNIKMIKSRPYHPQSQGKCERSHRTVRTKINHLNMRKDGFNWACDLDRVQIAMNESPKEVLGYYTPVNVYTSRQDDEMFNTMRTNRQNEATVQTGEMGTNRQNEATVQTGEMGTNKQNEATGQTGEMRTNKQNEATGQTGEMGKNKQNEATGQTGELRTNKQNEATGQTGEMGKNKQNEATAHTGELRTNKQNEATGQTGEMGK